jgi:hypothetical protein
LIDQVKVRVDAQLQSTLERLHEVFMERPAWAQEVASAESLRAVSAAVQALPKTAPTVAEMTTLRNAILALPQQSASPKAVEELKAAVDALRDDVNGQVLAAAHLTGALTALQTQQASLRAQQDSVVAACKRIEADLGALRQVAGLNETHLERLNRPWYRRLFSN